MKSVCGDSGQGAFPEQTNKPVVSNKFCERDLSSRFSSGEKMGRDGGEGRNRSPQASFLRQKCPCLPMSQALHRHYPTQHFSNTFADVSADSVRRKTKPSMPVRLATV